jgi:hypothetical protein
VAAKMVEAKSAAAEWGSYATDVPSMVQALQSRVDTLSTAKRLPKGMDATALGAVQSGLEAMKADWAKATAAFEGGNAIDAVALAKSAKAKGEELLGQLGMKKA